MALTHQLSPRLHLLCLRQSCPPWQHRARFHYVQWDLSYLCSISCSMVACLPFYMMLGAPLTKCPCAMLCLFVCLVHSIPVVCGGRRLTKDGTYTTRRQAGAVLFVRWKPSPPCETYSAAHQNNSPHRNGDWRSPRAEADDAMLEKLCLCLSTLSAHHHQRCRRGVKRAERQVQTLHLRQAERAISTTAAFRSNKVSRRSSTSLTLICFNDKKDKKKGRKSTRKRSWTQIS